MAAIKKNIGSVSTKTSKETKNIVTKKKISGETKTTRPIKKPKSPQAKQTEKINNIIEPPKVNLARPTDIEDEIILNDEVLSRDSNVEKTGEENILRMSDDVVIDSNMKRHESGYIISNDDYTEQNKSYLNIALVAKRYYKKSYHKIIDTEIRELT